PDLRTPPQCVSPGFFRRARIESHPLGGVPPPRGIPGEHSLPGWWVPWRQKAPLPQTTRPERERTLPQKELWEPAANLFSSNPFILSKKAKARRRKIPSTGHFHASVYPAAFLSACLAFASHAVT